jgi:NAD(P)-dependent dehydrogenase (short-subunit alcohol dehydrogenase family)
MKTILITGGNSGIGAAMACALSALGYGVTIICRSSEKAGAFIESAEKKGLGNIGFIRGDLGTLEGARAAAERIRDNAPVFSAFVHNAGIWPTERVMNVDGLEQSFVTNHLAPFILNLSLEDLFARNRCRVVQVSAGLYPLGEKDCGAAASGERFSLLKTYPTTKLLNLVTTMRFAERWHDSGIAINAVHPGVVKTGLGAIPGIRGKFLNFMKLFMLSPAKGAEAPLRLATDPSLEELSGRYFDRFAMKPLEGNAIDRDFAREAWEQAMRLTGMEERDAPKAETDQ